MIYILAYQALCSSIGLLILLPRLDQGLDVFGTETPRLVVFGLEVKRKKERTVYSKDQY